MARMRPGFGFTYNPSKRRRSRRRNTGAAGVIGEAKQTLRGAPMLLAAGANIGLGFLATGLLAGFVDRVSGGRLGRFNGIASTLAAAFIAAYVPGRLIGKVPYADKGNMLLGVGLYGIKQVLELVLPDSWKAPLGLGEYLRGPMGDYLQMPGGPAGLYQTVGGLGALSEYVPMGSPNAAAQARSDATAAQAMASSNPVAVADALLDQSELQEATFSGVGRMGEYVQTAPGIGAGAGGLGGGYDGGFWLGQGQYATFENPDPPASRFLNYGGQQFAPMPGAAIPGQVPVASTPFASPVVPSGVCNPCGPGGGCGPSVPGVSPMGPCGDQLFQGPMPVSASLCPTAPIGGSCGVDAGGLFQSPWQNLIANIG